MAITYVALASATVSNATTTTVTFSNIPSTYTDLLIRTSVRKSNNGYIQYIRYNNDSTTKYSYVMAYTDYNTGFFYGTSGSSLTETYWAGSINANFTTASTFASNEIYIPDYTSTNAKQILIKGFPEDLSATIPYGMLHASLYQGTSAISTIEFIADTSAGLYYAQNSTFHLYGIKKA